MQILRNWQWRAPFVLATDSNKTCTRGFRDVIIDIPCQMLYADFPVLITIFAQSGSILVLLLAVLVGETVCRFCSPLLTSEFLQCEEWCHSQECFPDPGELSGFFAICLIQLSSKQVSLLQFSCVSSSFLFCFLCLVCLPLTKAFREMEEIWKWNENGPILLPW